MAHVVGATVLGYFVADEAARFVLDINFIWAVYLDGEMGLVPRSMALEELPFSAADRARLAAEVEALHDGDASAPFVAVTPAPDGCLITAVETYARDAARRLVIRGEGASLVVETNLTTRALAVAPLADEEEGTDDRGRE
ncbi:MAG TPA: hypothetical protein VF546_17000 [Pyrinomonadaceae bacterium]